MTAPISNIPGLSGLGSIQGTPTQSGGGEFGKVLQGTINSLESAQKDANTSINKFLTGENQEIHNTVLATQKASMTFELGLQVRNKVVSAYQEIMKMQM